MNNNKNIISLKILSTIILDIGFILFYLKVLSFYSIIHPYKASLIFLVLIISLVISNIVIIFSKPIVKLLGIPYFIMTISLITIYCLLSNILALFSIRISIFTFSTFQLILLSILIGGISAILYFSSKVNKDVLNLNIEKTSMLSLKANILRIENLLDKNYKLNGDSAIDLLNSFKNFKEKIYASTPIGRNTNTVQVLEIEDMIIDNLVLIEDILKENKLIESSSNLLDLINETTNLVKNRENLLVI